MLDTTSSNTEFPLFGSKTATFSSYGMERIVIQQPLPTESYSWSDFPMALRDETDSATISQATPSSCSISSSSTFPNSNHSTDDGDGDDSHSPSSSFSSSQGPHKVCEPPTSPADTTASSSSRTIINPSKNSVRFALFPEVRIYSLVLGDHPLCDDGLAIELGWDYCYDQEENKNFDSIYTSIHSSSNECDAATQQQRHHRTAVTHTTRSSISTTERRSCQKRSYLSRKQLLLDVARCTKEELDQRSRESARSHLEDYYYRLAFANRL